MNNRTRTWLAVAALAAMLPIGAGAATVVTTGDHAAFRTSFDSVIDLIVQQRVAAQKLSPAQSMVAREQLQIQFMSLSKAAQQKLVEMARNAKSEEAAAKLAGALHTAVTDEAREALAEAQAKLDGNASQARPAPKLGGDGDLVFVATAGPCRVWDSRFGMGPLAAFSATQIYGWSTFAGYSWATGDNQGGTGTAGAGNCVGTVYPGTSPVSVVATVVVVNTSSPGSLRAWNGGTTLTVGGVLGWQAGDALSNTTVIPMNRFIAAYPGSGFKRDFGLYNNSPSAIDTIVDVVGYFIENQATALDCTAVFGTLTNIPANSSIFLNAPACPTGYTTMTSGTTLGDGRYTSTLQQGSCRLGNLTGGVLQGSCDAFCCRVPGR